MWQLALGFSVLFVCLAIEDAVTSTTAAEHLQCLHSADGFDAICCPLHMPRLSQEPV